MHLLLLLFIQTGLLWGMVELQRGPNMGQTGAGEIYRRRGEFTPPPSLLDLEELNKVLFSDFKKHNHDLMKAKYYLINGETRMAQVFLMKLAYANTKLRPIIYRYTAILSFIEGDFKKAYELLRKKELQMTPHFGRICALRALTQVILNVTHDLQKQWDRCRNENFGQLIPSNGPWIETLIDLKLNPRPGATKVPFKHVRLEAMDNEELKIFLKLALYLNQEKLVLSEIPLLQVGQLQDPEVRELVGHILFRKGSLADSYRYVEDLNSPNSETIKGNLYVLRKKYELAYAQFKLALEQKKNSQNAMERLLPLSWILGDWSEGAKYAERVIASPQTLINKMTLAAAFHVQKGSFEDAKKILNTITLKSRRGSEIDVTQLYSFTALMQNNTAEAKKYAGLSCAQYDLTNCWMLFQLSQWDAFPIMVRREDQITHKREWEKLAKEDINDPLEETNYVNQIDIEELDDKLIRLIPQGTK